MNESVPAYGLWSLVVINSAVFMYVQLARREEREALAEFGDRYRNYLRAVPAFVPRFPGPGNEGADPPPHTRAGGP